MPFSLSALAIIMYKMRYALALSVLFIFFTCPLLAEEYEPVDETASYNIVSRNPVPEQIQDMIKAPEIADGKYGLPFRRSPWEAGLKAAVFPGWGHFYLEHYYKAWLIVGAETLILVGIMNSDTEKYVNAKPEIRDAVYQQRETLGALGGLIWLWNIFDATGLAIENNRLIDEEEKKMSLRIDEAIAVSWTRTW
jgi:hypothetical protein